MSEQTDLNPFGLGLRIYQDDEDVVAVLVLGSSYKFPVHLGEMKRTDTTLGEWAEALLRGFQQKLTGGGDDEGDDNEV